MVAQAKFSPVRFSISKVAKIVVGIPQQHMQNLQKIRSMGGAWYVMDLSSFLSVASAIGC